MARSKYLFVASMDVDPAKEALFNEVYNTEHCPELGKGARSGRDNPLRGGVLQGDDWGREPKRWPPTDAPGSTPSTRSSRRKCCPRRAWGEAVELGRWPEQVRPYTTNRRHTLLRLTYPGESRGERRVSLEMPMSGNAHQSKEPGDCGFWPLTGN